MLPQAQYIRRPAVGPNVRNFYANFPNQPAVAAVNPFNNAASSNSGSTPAAPPKPIESRAQKQVGSNFLPSIVNEAYHNVLEQVVTAMCYKNGFDDIGEGALETLMLLFHSYIKRIGEQARLACEAAGRTIVCPSDAHFAVINTGIKVHQLPEFLRELAASSLTVHPPEITPAETKTQSLRIGKPRPHPAYVFDWLPPLPDPHTYIKTQIVEDPEMSYEKVREAMASKKRNGVTSLVNYMVRNYPTHCLFDTFEQIIHEEVRNTFAKESEEKRMQEAFRSFRDLLQTDDIDEVKNVAQTLFNKGLINQHDVQSGAEVVCMCSDGALVDQNGERVRLSDSALIDLEERDKVSKSTTRMSVCGDGAASLRYHWTMDEMLDEIIEVDSCTMDLAEERREKEAGELKYMQEKTTFEYIPEWCHVLVPSFEHRAYLDVVLADLKAEEEGKKEKDAENGQDDDETPKVKEESDTETTHENLYLCPPHRDADDEDVDHDDDDEEEDDDDDDDVEDDVAEDVEEDVEPMET